MVPRFFRKLRRIKKIVSAGRIMTISLILAVSTLGFINRSPRLDSPLSRIETAQYIMKFLDGLSPEVHFPAKSTPQLPIIFSDLPESFSKRAKSFLSLGIMEGFPDGTFRPNAAVSRIELIHIWHKLLSSLWKASPDCYPIYQSKSPATCLPQAWIHSFLCLGESGLDELSFETFLGMATHGEIRQLQHHTMEFFSIDHVVLIPGENELFFWVKSPSGRISNDGKWKFHFGNKVWQPLPENAALPFPKSISRQICFQHPMVSEIRINLPTQLSTPYLKALILKNAELFDEFQTVTGQVCDAISQKPIPNATISLLDRAVQTNANGFFSIACKAGNSFFELFITAEKYKNLILKNTIQNRKNLVILLNPFRTNLEGRIVSSSSGNPVPNANIEASGKTFQTDKFGNFKSPKLSPGYYRLEISASGFQKSSELVFIGEKPATRTIKLHPQFFQ